MEFYNPLCNYASSIVRNDNTAEDIVQEVFLHLWEHNDTLEVKTHMQQLLFSSVKNKSLEYLRTSKSSTDVTTFADALAYNDENIEQTGQKYMTMEVLSNLMRHLPPKCKNVFALHRFNGLTYAEIADRESISIKTVENHILKAIKILRSEYSKSL